MKTPSEKTMLVAIENSVNSIIITDKDGLIIWVNPSFPVLTGYTLEDVYGKNPRMLKSGFHNHEFYRNMWETISSKKQWKGLLVNKTKSGELYKAMTSITPVIGPNGQIDSFIAIQEEVSLANKIVDDLAWSEKKLVTIFDVVETPLFILSPNGVFLTSNRAAEELFGFSKSEFMRMDYLDLTHPEDKMRSEEGLKSAIKNQDIERYMMEKRYIKKDGGIVYGSMSCAISRDAYGNCVFLVAQVKDLTKEKNLTEKILKDASAMSDANKIFKVVSEISQFTVNQEIFNLDDVLQFAGDKLKMACIFVQNCQEKVEIYKLWHSESYGITEEEMQKMQEICDIHKISDWVEEAHSFIGRSDSAPDALTHIFSVESIKKSSQTYVLPILIKQRAWGIIGFVNGNGHQWSEAEKEALRFLGRLIVVMIENNGEKSRLIDHISFKFEELENVIDRKDSIQNREVKQ
jgi:PAS domain S-box-containing protein